MSGTGMALADEGEQMAVSRVAARVTASLYGVSGSPVTPTTRIGAEPCAFHGPA
jgi:hypothetical protein